MRLANEQGQEVSPAELVRAAERYRLMGLVDRGGEVLPELVFEGLALLAAEIDDQPQTGGPL